MKFHIPHRTSAGLLVSSHQKPPSHQAAAAVDVSYRPPPLSNKYVLLHYCRTTARNASFKTLNSQLKFVVQVNWT